MLTDHSIAALEFTTSDGVTISLDWHTRTTEPAPVVLHQTPYIKADLDDGSLPIPALIDSGYHVVTMDIRGTGASGGTFLGPVSPREVIDATEIVEFLADHELSNGKIALAGASYPGAIQFLVAAHRPRGLVCIMPGVAPIDAYRDWLRLGGIPQHSNWAAMTFLQQNNPAASVKPALDRFYGEILSQTEDGPIFREFSPIEVLNRIVAPVLLIGGVHDYFRRGTYRAYDELTAPKRMVLGPWGHGYPSDPSELITWLDYWTRGIGDDPTSGESIRLWDIAGARWSYAAATDAMAEWRTVPLADNDVVVPVTATKRGWPDGPPSPIDWREETATHSGMHLWGTSVRQELAEVDADLVTGGVILDLDLTLEGCVDADLYARLSLIDDAGIEQQLTEGRLRLSHHTIDAELSAVDSDGGYIRIGHTHVAPEPLGDGVATRVLIELLPTCTSIPKDWRLAIGFSACRADGGTRAGRITLSRGTRVRLPLARGTEAAP